MRCNKKKSIWGSGDCLGIMSLLSLVASARPSSSFSFLLTSPSPALCTHSPSWTNITTKSSEIERERERAREGRLCHTSSSRFPVIRSAVIPSLPPFLPPSPLLSFPLVMYKTYKWNFTWLRWLPRSRRRVGLWCAVARVPSFPSVM